jgi:hypothetical protein
MESILDASKAEAKSFQAQADIAELNIRQSEIAEKINTRRLNRNIEKTLGAIRAAAGASGVRLSGDLMADNAREAALDQELLKHSGEMERNRFAYDAFYAREAARDVKKAGRKAAFGKAIGGIGGAVGSL